ncbi:MAG: HAD family hydrolase [Promethearchaeota archaeon]
MSFEEKYQKDPEKYNKKIFGTQKVKLYLIKHWIFDFGGVLAEAPNIVSKMIKILNNDLGTNMNKADPFISFNRRKLSSGRITSREFLKLIISHYYKKVDDVDIDHYLDLWFEKYSRLTQLSPKMEEIIHRLKHTGYYVSLLSNTYDIHAKSNQLKGFFDLFDFVFLSNELKMRKPELEQYKYVLEKLKAKPKECIFIDDKLMNLVPARKLGMYVIQFKSFDLFKQYLNALGITKIDKNLKRKIREKYEQYELSKKEAKKAKKKYKKLKKEYKTLKKKKKKKRRYYFKYKKVKKQLKFLENQYKLKSKQYKEDKKTKEKILERKLKLERPPEKKNNH